MRSYFRVVPKYPNAELDLGWQYLFASRTLSVDPREREAEVKRRHHVNVSSFEKAIKAAAIKSGLTKRITPHTFRHGFATHLLEMHTNIKKVPVQEYGTADDRLRLFRSPGVYEFTVGRKSAVIVSNAQSGGYVVIDAVQWLPK